MDQNLDWLQGCKDGDHKSQKALFEQWYSYAWTVCNAYATSKEDTEEMVADGFIRMFSNLDKYDSERPFKAWFRIILVHAALNHLKKRRDFYQFLDDGINLPTAEPDAIARMGYDELVKAIRHLPPVYRSVMILFALEGWSHAEIAEELNIAERTSRANLTRARSYLTKWIKTNYKEKMINHG